MGTDMMSARAVLITLTLAMGLSSAVAEPQELGAFNDWRVFRTTDKIGTVCFALSEPTSKKPAGVKRGEIYFMVSSWPSEKVSGEPSIVPGYPYKEQEKAVVEIGTDRFEFYTQNNAKEDGGDGGAWMKDTKEEEQLLAAMKKGSKMVVKGTSRRGTKTTDEYSLKGISAALDKLASECGRPVADSRQ